MKKMSITRALLVSFLCLSTLQAEKSALPIPRFVSLRSREVNVRVGPGFQFPLRWQLVRREPVEIIAEFSTWRKIRCHDGAEGWVHQSMLSGKRLVKMTQETTLRRRAFNGARPLAILQANVIAEFLDIQGDWCRIKVKDFKGWVPKEAIWGAP